MIPDRRYAIAVLGVCVFLYKPCAAKDLSRARMDAAESRLAAATELPTSCIEDALELSSGPWTMVHTIKDGFVKHPPRDPACRHDLNADETHAAPYPLVRELIDGIALLDRAAETPGRWALFVNQAGLLAQTYRNDPEPLLGASARNFLRAFHLPRVWDPDAIPTPLETLHAERVVGALNQWVDALQKLTENGQWPALSAADVEVLSRRLDLLMPSDRKVIFPGLDALIDRLRQWLALSGHL